MTGISRDEELRLAALIATGDRQATLDLFNHYSWVASIAVKSYVSRGHDADDLRQEALIGIYEACESFDPFTHEDTDFFTHAISRARYHIASFVRSELSYTRSGGMNISQWIQRFLKKHNYKVEWLPSDEQMMEAYNLSKRRAGLIRGALIRYYVIENVYDDFHAYYDEIALLRKYMDGLSHKVREALTHRYGLNGEEPKSFSTMAETLQIKDSAARMRCTTGIRTLRTLFRVGVDQ
jgi:RNA polymerase sigma factor (sigma-70 family)